MSRVSKTCAFEQRFYILNCPAPISNGNHSFPIGDLRFSSKGPVKIQLSTPLSSAARIMSALQATGPHVFMRNMGRI